VRPPQGLATADEPRAGAGGWGADGVAGRGGVARAAAAARGGTAAQSAACAPSGAELGGCSCAVAAGGASEAATGRRRGPHSPGGVAGLRLSGGESGDDATTAVAAAPSWRRHLRTPRTRRPTRRKRRGGGVLSPSPRGDAEACRRRAGWRRLGRRARWVAPLRQRTRRRQERAARPLHPPVARQPRRCVRLAGRDGVASAASTPGGGRAPAAASGGAAAAAAVHAPSGFRRPARGGEAAADGGSDAAAVSRRGRPPSGDGGVTAAVAGRKVEGCSGGAAPTGGAAQARLPVCFIGGAPPRVVAATSAGRSCSSDPAGVPDGAVKSGRAATAGGQSRPKLPATALPPQTPQP